MQDAAKFRPNEVDPIVDPTTGSGQVWVFPEGFGQAGKPFVLRVEDPPHKTRARHYHHGDVLYFYVQGEHHIEGEGTYRAGDVRWTRAGHAYGPETTGPEGGTWWVVSYQDPIPVDVIDATAAPAKDIAETSAELDMFARPYNWDAIDQLVRSKGGVVLKGFFEEPFLLQLDEEIDAFLAANPEAGTPASGSDGYNMFLGARTVRLHGLVEKFASGGALISNEELVAFAERAMAERAESVLLNAGELIQIGPGEPAQVLHRDTDSWMDLPIGEAPILTNAIVALDPFTLENGATYLAAGSWRWDRHRQPTLKELSRAVLDRGDVVLFRGDLMHGGGENVSSGRRRGISLSYCAGWLRTVENGFLNVSAETAKQAPPRLKALLGYKAHDATSKRGGLLGLHENGDPALALAKRG